MKNNTILIIVIIVLVGLTSLTMTGRADIMENEHYFIMGHIYEPYNNTYVTIENTRTMEIQIIELIDCEHELKEYLFDLANLKQGWLNTDDIIITYDDESVKIKINKNTIKIQLDFNQPNDYIPISIITGAVLILSGRYYIKRRKQIMSEENAETENIKTNENILEEKRCLIDMVFGGTKKAFIIISTIGVMSAFATGLDIPTEAWIVYSTIVGNYFGVGGVKLGMNTK